MNEQALSYTLPPADKSLDALIGVDIQPANDDDALPIGKVIDATVHAQDKESVTLRADEQSIVVPIKDARDLHGKLPAKGETVRVLIDEKNDDDTWTGSIDKTRQLERYDALMAQSKSKSKVNATLLVALRNGFSAEVEGFRAFLPYKDSGIRANQAFDVIGETVDVHITDIDRQTLDLRLSRKQIAEQEQAAAFKEVAQKLNVMDVVEGTVTSTTNFGAFVDINGIEGLIHISEMSTERVSANNLPVRVGETVRVQVVSIDDKRGRIGLSRKEILLEEQRKKIAKLPVNTIIEGRVEGITDFGAFVDIGDGLSGLCHISEMSWTERVENPGELLKVGETHKFRIVNVDPATARISLSLRQATVNPWSDFVDKTPVGAQLDGRIKEVVERGLVIDLGDNIEGFVRLSDLSWTIHAESPSDVRDFEVGESLTLALLRVDPSRQSILLGLKQMEPDPWDSAGDITTKGHVFTAEVAQVTESAAFFNIVPGLVARMHISEISTERIESIRSVLRIGQEVEVMTINAERARRRLDVSIKAIEAKRLREQPHSYSEEGRMGIMADAFRTSGLVESEKTSDKPVAKDASTKESVSDEAITDETTAPSEDTAAKETVTEEKTAISEDTAAKETVTEEKTATSEDTAAKEAAAEETPVTSGEAVTEDAAEEEK